MVVDIQIISEGLTSPDDCSVSLVDPSQAKPVNGAILSAGCSGALSCSAERIMRTGRKPKLVELIQKRETQFFKGEED